MVKYDRIAHMKSIHAQRKASTYAKVDEAIQRLIRANETINFNSVASESGVSKGTLYNTSDLRERIEKLRLQQSQTLTKKQLKREMNDANKGALIETLKRKIKKIEIENKELREQLKVAYADVYKRI
ncbi:DUF6262 family protein [Bacillus mycoides]|uniref:DUF6262 family protein n=1 Tax=Bacillus mycoides TaxID=1405 RepID=UPI0035CAA58F